MKQKLLLKTMLLLCALVAGSSSVWAADQTITLDYNSFGLTTSYAEKTATVSGFGFTVNQGYKGSGNVIQMNSSKGSGILYNTTAIPGLKSITVNVSSGNKTYTITTGTSEKPTANSQTGITGGTYNATSGDTYFQLQVSGASYFSSIVITYTPSHTITYSTENGSISGVDANSTAVASGASVAEGATVTLTATPASGYAFTSWSVSGDDSELSSTTTNPTTFTMGTANATVTANFEVSSTVATPTFSVAEGTYNDAQSVELNCTTDDATIYYTTDGTDPTTSSSVYSSAIAVNQTTTIKAFAVKAGLTNSAIASATYTLQCATPTITVPSGAFLDTKVVTMTSSDGASIYYTTDGTTPTNSSTVYDPSNKPSISATTTIKAIAIKDGWSDSEVATETFTKITPLTVAEAIAATPSSGTLADQYIHGIVSAFYNTDVVTDGSNRYYISDDGTTTGQLLVFKGKGLNNVAFSAASDLQIGDDIVIYGGLTTYSSTKEVASGNYIVSLSRKPAPTFTLDPTSKSLDAYSHETVDVTLTTNTDGAITCESSNEDVATVALKSGNVYTITAQTAGTATITIKSAMSANYQAAQATVTITVTDDREDAEISFANATVTKTWGQEFTGQELTNPHALPVTWSSTDEAVATVSSTGAVTVLKAGTTTIKATFVGDVTYKAAVASYTLTVNKANAGLSYTTTSFDIMLNDDSFVAPTLNNPNGLTVTYVSNNTDVALVGENDGVLAYEESVAGSATITASFAGNDWYKSGSASYTINIIDPTVKGTKYNPYTVAEVIAMAPTSTSEVASGQGDIYVTGYIVGEYRNSNTTTTTVLQSSFTTDANIAIADDPTTTALASSIPVNLTKTADQKAFGNKSNNGKAMGCKVLVKGDALKYFGAPGFKNIDEISAVSVSITPAKTYTTLTSKFALDFTGLAGLEAYIVKDNDLSDNAVTLTQVNKVPANTGLVLVKTSGTTFDVPVFDGTGADDITGNKMAGSATATTAITANGGYILSEGAFHPANAGTLPAGKAYLNIPASAPVLNLDFGDATNISTTNFTNYSGEYYNLAGQRVANPTKGLYIVNGKKVILK